MALSDRSSVSASAGARRAGRGVRPRAGARRPLRGGLRLEAVLAQHADDHAADTDLVAADDERQHLRIGRLEADLAAGERKSFLTVTWPSISATTVRPSSAVSHGSTIR